MGDSLSYLDNLLFLLILTLCCRVFSFVAVLSVETLRSAAIRHENIQSLFYPAVARTIRFPGPRYIRQFRNTKFPIQPLSSGAPPMPKDRGCVEH